MKIAKRALILILAAILLLPSFAGCSKTKEKIVLSFGNVKITADVYRYWLSSFKYYFVSRYEDIDDTVECWRRDLGNGQTVGEYVEDYTLQYAKSVLCSLKLFNDYKLKLPKEATEEIDDSISEIIRYQFNDSKAEFNSALMETYGIGINMLREAFIYEAKVDFLEQYLFGEKGIAVPTAEETDAYYKANYVRVGMIVLNISSVPETDLEGNPVLDGSGNPVTRPLTDGELAEKEQAATELLEKLKGGEDIFALSKEYGDQDLSDRQNGYYFARDERASLVASGYDRDLVDGIFTLNAGESASYRTEEAIVLIQSLPLADGAYKSEEDSDQFSSLNDYVISDKYEKMMKEMWDGIVVDDYVYTLKAEDVKKGFI